MSNTNTPAIESLTFDQAKAAGLVRVVHKVVRAHADGRPDVVIFETKDGAAAYVALKQITKMSAPSDDHWYEVNEMMLIEPLAA